MVLLWARDGYYMAYAIGTTDLTAWGNAQAALVVGELNALDWFYNASITHTKPRTININPMTATHYPKRLQTGRTLGRLATTHYLQTGILTYAVMGVCATTANGAEVTDVTCGATSTLTTSDYFFINCVNGAGAEVANYVWFQIDAAGADPTPGGTGIEVDITTGQTAAQVATALKDKLDAEANYGASVADTVVTITNANPGGVDDAVDGNTDFTITTTTQGSSKHAITKGTTEAPIRLAFHYEKEGAAANRRKDVMGFIPNTIEISVSETSPIAMQTYNGEFAFTGAGSDLAQPTAFKQSVLEPYNWYNYKHASGASEFKYNGGAINVDIVDIVMRIGWEGSLFKVYDSTGYPTDGLVKPPFVGEVDLGVRLTDEAGTVLDDISDLAHGSYAGDLDFVCDFYKSAIHYNKYTWDKMFIDPDSYEEVFQAEGEWFDGRRFTLVWLDENSSLAVEEKNNLNKKYYEND